MKQCQTRSQWHDGCGLQLVILLNTPLKSVLLIFPSHLVFYYVVYALCCYGALKCSVHFSLNLHCHFFFGWVFSLWYRLKSPLQAAPGQLGARYICDGSTHSTCCYFYLNFFLATHLTIEISYHSFMTVNIINCWNVHFKVFGFCLVVFALFTYLCINFWLYLFWFSKKKVID